MSESEQGYRAAFKATGLFGGVQLITILIGIVKSKFIAIWLGPSGYGIMSLFSSVISLISAISNLGLASSAVRDISKAKAVNDGGIQLAKTVKAVNRCVVITGLFGASFTILLSRVLSEFSFGSSIYTQSFILLSIVVFVNGIYGGHYATLQGVRNLSSMAKARILGSLLGTSVTLPLFYFYKEKGIVPALIATSLITYIVSSFYVRKIKLVDVAQTLQESFRIGRTTVQLGIMMATTAISVSVVEFLVKTFITRTGGISDVGFYQAGWTLNAQYLGLVFTAMATDYFPRLSSISQDNRLLEKRMNEQAEIAVLILGPMIAGMLVLMPILIKILYSSDFLEIVSMTRWLMFGSLVKAGSWAVSFIFLAKGDGKTFLFNELGIKSVTIPSYLLGYYFWGINGIGYAFTSNYIIYFIWVTLVARRKYELSYSRSFQKLLFIQIISSLALIYFITNISGFLMYTVASLLLAFIVTYSLKGLNEKLELIPYIKKRLFGK